MHCLGALDPMRLRTPGICHTCANLHGQGPSIDGKAHRLNGLYVCPDFSPLLPATNQAASTSGGADGGGLSSAQAEGFSSGVQSTSPLRSSADNRATSADTAAAAHSFNS